MKKTLICSFDDLFEGNDKWDKFIELHNEIPELKITFFVNPGQCTEEFLLKIQVPWVELVYHAENHSGGFQNWSKKETKEKLLKYVNKYNFKKGFKPPAYKWTENIINACNELNFWMCSSPSVPFFVWKDGKWDSSLKLSAKKYWYTDPKAGFKKYKEYDEFYDHIQNKDFDKNIDELRKYYKDSQPNYKFISEVIHYA